MFDHPVFFILPLFMQLIQECIGFAWSDGFLNATKSCGIVDGSGAGVSRIIVDRLSCNRDNVVASR